jgi:2-methylfumaryl-CoA hydratase
MKGSRFGRRLVYGGHIISVCRALSYDGLENVISIAAINGGSHTNPTFAGDTLYAKSFIVEKIPLRPDLGAIRIRLLGIKDVAPADIDANNPQLPESVVLDLDYTVLVPRLINTSLEHS